MTVKQHVKRLNEFKKLLDKEDQDQNIEALRKNDEFMAEFDGLDKKWVESYAISTSLQWCF